MTKGNPTPTQLRELMKYDPETGLLTWRERAEHWFPVGAYGRQHSANIFNKLFAGKPALNSVSTSTGYRRGNLFKKTTPAHRVAFAIHYGKWPEGHIDHINGDRTDNRIKNLRDVTRAENQKNQKLRSDNASGTPGVGYCKANKGWRARINVNKKSITLGYFKTKAAAVSARKDAERLHGYHANHGRAA